MTDRFQAHIGVVVIAVVALGAVAAVVWQVVHGHSVDPLLAGIATGAVGVLTPTPLSRQTVTVDNPSSDPVPVAPSVPNGGPSLAEKVPLVEPTRKARRRVDKGHADPILVVLIVLVVLLVLAVAHVL